MAFEGFSKDADYFFAELGVRQDRDWFKARKADHERLWVAPMKALLAELRPGLERTFKGFKLLPDKHFRIYRDVRFSNDKSPFKTHQAAMVKFDDGQSGELMSGAAAAIYLHLGTEDDVGLGHWLMSPDELKKYRAMLLEDKRGGSIAKKAEALQKNGFTVTAFETLKRPPPGVKPDHPRAWLMQRKGLGLEMPKIPKAVRHSKKLKDWLLEQVRVAAPVVMELEKIRRRW